jgi:hypothetical protein
MHFMSNSGRIKYHHISNLWKKKFALSILAFAVKMGLEKRSTGRLETGSKFRKLLTKILKLFCNFGP